ncbi:MAG TPA: hypothetical protein PKY82_01375 [Pyrinomonadaceae bacterium]|nr:hypothetical protein [Pyrinomonadaceae bacterium]
MKKNVIALLIALFSCAIVNAQPERYELGKRTRALEIELEKPTTPEVRKNAMAEITKSVQKFFAFNLREAARDLDNARFILEQNTSDNKIWAESLAVSPDFRLLDEINPTINLTISNFYKVPQTIPKGAVVRFSLTPSAGASVKRLAEFSIKELPMTNKIALAKVKAGDYFLLSEIVVGNEVLANSKQLFSISAKLNERLKTLETKLGETKMSDWQTETSRENLKILQNLANGKTLETDYHANNLLNQTEVFAKVSTKFAAKNNQLTLIFPLKGGNQTSRILIPTNYDGKRETPLLIALHGAGGSENLFFDSYGNGKTVRLCEKRGWFLVAPRNFGFSAEKLDEFIENLTKLYKIDRTKIFLIGHSLGSIQSLMLAVTKPKTFAGVALISTGGAPKVSEEMKNLPFFLGTGTQDFSFNGTQSLHTLLTESGVKQVEYKVYDDIEHLTALQFSLNDVFRFFDEISTKR